MPSHSHQSLRSEPDPEDQTANLAEAIMLMTQELRRHEVSSAKRAKAKEPDTFDGSNPRNLNNFILLCNLYFRQNPSYSDDATKVTFALSYLRGTALEYFEPSILDSVKTPDWMDNWSAFIRTLRTQFGPIDPAADAEDGIDFLKMRENQKIVQYNVKFNRLAIRTGWDDSVLRHRYYSGLAERIKDTMGQQGKPATLEAMKTFAHSIDSRHWERLHEKSRSRNSDSSSENSAPYSVTRSGSSVTPPSSKPNSTPSDFSAKPLAFVPHNLGKDGKLTFQERQRRFDNNLCLCCGGSDHRVKECPKSVAKARTAQAKEYSDSEDSDSGNSDSSSESENSDSNSGNSDSSSRNSDSASGNSDSSSENSDTDSGNSDSESVYYDAEDSSPEISDSESESSRLPIYEDSESDDSRSDSE
jgi:Domain of unknown function (DUF4939)